jgi:hypothetical protein
MVDRQGHSPDKTKKTRPERRSPSAHHEQKQRATDLECGDLSPLFRCDSKNFSRSLHGLASIHDSSLQCFSAPFAGARTTTP